MRAWPRSPRWRGWTQRTLTSTPSVAASSPAAQLSTEKGKEGQLDNPDDAITDKDRTDFLARAAELYQKVYDNTNGKAGHELLTINSLYGLAAVAEGRQELDKAKGFYEQIAKLADASHFPAHAALANDRIKKLPDLATAPKLYTKAELPPVPKKEEPAPPVVENPAPAPAPTPAATPTPAPAPGTETPASPAPPANPNPAPAPTPAPDHPARGARTVANSHACPRSHTRPRGSSKMTGRKPDKKGPTPDGPHGSAGEDVAWSQGFILPGGKVDSEAMHKAMAEAEASGAAEDEDAAMRTVSFKLQKDLNKRLDKYLTDRITFMSRNQLQKLIDEGGVMVNGRLPKASTKLGGTGTWSRSSCPPRRARTSSPRTSRWMCSTRTST